MIAPPGPRSRRRRSREGALAVVAVVAGVGMAGGPALAAVSRMPRDFRPVAAEGTARSVWVNPAGIGSSGEQSLMVEGTWRESDSGDLLGELTTLTVAASTDHTAYLYVHEMDDVPGVADWTLMVANRMARPRGLDFGSALEWRGGESRTADGTVSMSKRFGGGLTGALVLEDVFESDVDGEPGTRHWRGGLAFRPGNGRAFLAWDYDRLARDDTGRHWLALGLDGGKGVLVRVAANDDGDWSFRLGISPRNARFAGALLDPDRGARTAVTSIDFLGDPIVR